MIKIEIIHHINPDHINKVEKTEKVYKVFGIVVLRRVINYPNEKFSDFIRIF